MKINFNIKKRSKITKDNICVNSKILAISEFKVDRVYRYIKGKIYTVTFISEADFSFIGENKRPQSILFSGHLIKHFVVYED